MAKKKRPSLKNYLSTGEVFADENGQESSAAEISVEKKETEGEEKKRPAKARKTPAKKKIAAEKIRKNPERKTADAEIEGEEIIATKPETPETVAEPETVCEPVSRADATAEIHEAAAEPDVSEEKESEQPRGDEAISASSREELCYFLDLLCDEDRKMWEKVFAAVEAEFLPLDFIERREDFRTMDRSRFTLFRLDEEGHPLFHVRTSVQIREPLIALLKWDETGRVSIYRP